MFELEHHEPRVAVEVREMLHTEAARLVRDGGADVAITLNARAEPELVQARGWSEPLMAVAPFGNSFGERDRTSLRDLADQTLAPPSPVESPG